MYNFNDYIKFFTSFVKEKKMPITFSGWYRSLYSGSFGTGIVIDIAGLSAGDDTVKEESFMNSPCFEFYLNAALQAGFSIDKNAPWLLVADLNSPAMEKYHDRWSLSSTDFIFSQKYKKIYLSDIQMLRTYLLDNFNYLINIRSKEREIKVSCTGKSIIHIFERDTITYEQLIKQVPSSVWLEVYIRVRNMEEDGVFGEPDLLRMKKNALQIQKYLDTRKAISYINDQYLSVFNNRKGGLNHIKRKILHKERVKKFGKKTLPQSGGGTGGGSTSGGTMGGGY
jgi:hypothetical protein